MLIQMIRCPVTHSGLTAASETVIADLNGRIVDGSLTNWVGKTVIRKLDGGFVNADQSLLHPVRGGIVTLIADQGIRLDRIVQSP